MINWIEPQYIVVGEKFEPQTIIQSSRETYIRVLNSKYIKTNKKWLIIVITFFILSSIGIVLTHGENSDWRRMWIGMFIVSSIRGLFRFFLLGIIQIFSIRIPDLRFINIDKNRIEIRSKNNTEIIERCLVERIVLQVLAPGVGSIKLMRIKFQKGPFLNVALQENMTFKSLESKLLKLGYEVGVSSKRLTQF